MAQPKFFSPFPRLQLSLEDKKELCRISKQLVGEVSDGFERFLWNENGQVDPFRWALVKEKEDVRVYHDRQSGAKSENKELNVMLTVGNVQGSLDDAMYGVINHTTDAMRIKTAYAKDTMVNCAVLATVLEPTVEKPFRSMTVKWGVKSMPLAMRAICKNRDIVYVESVGTKTLSNGERVGFQLLHSIDFKYAQPLPSYIRSNISSCSIWRQKSPERTQVFMKSFLDIPDGFMAPVVIRSAADAFIAVCRSVHVAQMKKLAWLMRRRRSSVVDEEPPSEEHGCAICGSQSPTSNRQVAKSVCTICNRFVCSTCRVRRELCSISPDSQLIERRVAFCVPCLSVTGRVSSADIARDEIGGGRAAPVWPLSELVKSCSSVARFSYSTSVPSQSRNHETYGAVLSQPRENKRRSMTLVAPIKSSATSAATPTRRHASTPTTGISPPGKSCSWGHV